MTGGLSDAHTPRIVDFSPLFTGLTYDASKAYDERVFTSGFLRRFCAVGILGIDQ